MLSSVKSNPARARLPCAPPWMYHPAGQPKPSIAISRLFQPFGAENGVGAGSLVGSCNTAL